MLLTNGDTPVTRAKLRVRRVFPAWHIFRSDARLRVEFSALSWPGLRRANPEPSISAYYVLPHGCSKFKAGTPCLAPLAPGALSRLYRDLRVALSGCLAIGVETGIAEALGDKILLAAIQSVTTDRADRPLAVPYSKVSALLGVEPCAEWTG
jgi:hypothetical protein